MSKNVKPTLTSKPKRHWTPRPTLLTSEVQDKIVSYLKASNYFETACQAVGIRRQLAYAWMARGEKEGSGIYYDFREAVLLAEAQAEVADIALVKSRQDNWQALAWIRERKNFGRWGRKQAVVGPDGGPIQIEHTLTQIAQVFLAINVLPTPEAREKAFAEKVNLLLTAGKPKLGGEHSDH